jgi:hypothetical protein
MNGSDVHRVWWESLRKGHHLGDPNVGRRTILKWISEKWVGGLDWIDLAEDGDR